MTTTPSSPDQTTDQNGPEQWVREAIAQQEEYLKRIRSCAGQAGLAHDFRNFGRRSPDGTVASAATWRECLACGATETDADYQARLGVGD